MKRIAGHPIPIGTENLRPPRNAGAPTSLAIHHMAIARVFAPSGLAVKGKSGDPSLSPRPCCWVFGLALTVAGRARCAALIRLNRLATGGRQIGRPVLGEVFLADDFVSVGLLALLLIWCCRCS